MKELRVTFKHDGTMQFIYDDDFVPLLKQGDFIRCRASDVEPTAGSVGYTADMGRVGGPVLGPFETRQAALDAEVQWLRQERGL